MSDVAGGLAFEPFCSQCGNPTGVGVVADTVKDSFTIVCAPCFAAPDGQEPSA